jgi:hypothetical protein
LSELPGPKVRGTAARISQVTPYPLALAYPLYSSALEYVRHKVCWSVGRNESFKSANQKPNRDSNTPPTVALEDGFGVGCVDAAFQSLEYGSEISN